MFYVVQLLRAIPDYRGQNVNQENYYVESTPSKEFTRNKRIVCFQVTIMQRLLCVVVATLSVIGGIECGVTPTAGKCRPISCETIPIDFETVS